MNSSDAPMTRVARLLIVVSTLTIVTSAILFNLASGHSLTNRDEVNAPANILSLNRLQDDEPELSTDGLVITNTADSWYYALRMYVSPGPVISQTSIITITARAVSASVAGTNTLYVRLPGYLRVDSSTPATTTVSAISAAYNTYTVTWNVALTVDAPITVVLSTTPLESATSPFHDQIEAFVALPTESLFSSLMIARAIAYIRVGTQFNPGSASHDWPDAVAVLSADSYDSRQPLTTTHHTYSGTPVAYPWIYPGAAKNRPDRSA